MTRPLENLRALVTSGPTHEAIDPVRYLANRSSGRQGHAIAAALAEAGAHVTLVTGPVELDDPQGMDVVHVTSAEEMYDACLGVLPVAIGVFAAAVGDWKMEQMPEQKMKKKVDGRMTLEMTENPDILKEISQHDTKRPLLVVGFAAETENIEENAEVKRSLKSCDWIVANDVSGGKGFGAQTNKVVLLDESGSEHWDEMSKEEIASKLVSRIEGIFDRGES